MEYLKQTGIICQLLLQERISGRFFMVLLQEVTHELGYVPAKLPDRPGIMADMANSS
jgi:hypothetical protein